MEFPESGLIKKTFIVRQMDLPPNVKLTKRSMLRWFALAFGLISEKESRTTMLDVLDTLFFFHLNKKASPSTLEIQSFIKQKANKTVSEKLIRYHLNRLIELNLVYRKNQKYFFNHSPYAERDDLKQGFNFHITNSLNKSLSDIEEVFSLLLDSYKK